MAVIARLIGGAGTGKTTELLNIMGQLLERGIRDPYQIGFVSFTRAARAEASKRAAARFGVPPDDLERRGNFRTLHSICYRALGVAQDAVVNGSAKSVAWLSEALQAPITMAVDPDADDAEVVFAPDTDAGKSLSLWSAARNRLAPLRSEWEAANLQDDMTPPWHTVVKIVERYEQAKRLDDKIDFVDMAGRFAGIRFDVEGHSERAEGPDGEVPALPVWFFDEQQDTSQLLDRVCQRLINTPQCKWVYVVGDPFQSIYSFSGADARWFLAWPADKQRIMPKSYRCPSTFLNLGERCLRQCSDYFDRKILPADHEGRLHEAIGLHALTDIDASADTLVLARTNWHVKRVCRVLDEHAIPWKPTKGNNSWLAPVRNSAIAALYNLEQGAPISGTEWQHILQHIPSKIAGTPALVHGTKKRFDKASEAERYQWVTLNELGELGATPALLNAIRTRDWRRMVKNADRTIQVLKRPDGVELLAEPKIRVGTVHSVKGAEADKVYLLTSTSQPIEKGQMATRELFNAERRVEYVAATRARYDMTIIKEPNEMRTGRYMKIAS